MNEEELIVHVQSYPFLYDLTDARCKMQHTAICLSGKMRGKK
ncbi:unnamed protein product [Callosobruchus maculatus]|uniref:Uncharacterized protein n=1 Tax=Callosobruchus maculatus TaxID=64391 RepID=A0A653DKE9_CALMS|nr:unnamed protein product [Callosobruchus maculatus]